MYESPNGCCCRRRRWPGGEKRNTTLITDLETTRAGVLGHEGARHERIQALGVHLGLQRVQQLLRACEARGKTGVVVVNAETLLMFTQFACGMNERVVRWRKTIDALRHGYESVHP